MEKICKNDNHKYGNYIEQENCFTRKCKCCQKETAYPKDPDIIKEYEKQQFTKELLTPILRKNIELISSNDSLLTRISILIDNLSRIEFPNEDPTELITAINTLNDYYNKSQGNNQSYQLIKNPIEFIDLYFKHEKLEILEIKSDKTTTTSEQNKEKQNDEFFDNWNNISEELELYIQAIYNSQKDHLQAR